MKEGYIKLFVLLSFYIMLSNCHGQVEHTSIKESTQELNTKSKGSFNIIRTQNSTESDNVNSSLEDEKGHLWFGTTGEGLYVFDGRTFRQYTKSDGLKSNHIFCVFESTDGVIWIGTYDGLYVFKDQTFKEIYISSPLHSLHNKFSVFSIIEDNKGKLWIATVEGVFVYDGNTFDLFIVKEDGKGYMSDQHNTEYMLQDSRGDLWFGSRVNKGVYRYDGTSIVNFRLENLDGHDWAWPALEDKEGNIWFNNWGGAYRYDGKTFTSFTKDDGLCSKTIMRIVEDKLGNIWFGGGEGICIYNGDFFRHLTIEDGLPQNGVWSILEDSDQNMWIGTRNTGLCVYNGDTVINLSESKKSDSKN